MKKHKAKPTLKDIVCARDHDLLVTVSGTLSGLCQQIEELKQKIGQYGRSVDNLSRKCVATIPVCETSGLLDNLKAVKEKCVSQGITPKIIFISQVGVSAEALKMIFEDPWFVNMQMCAVRELKDGTFIIGGPIATQSTT